MRKLLLLVALTACGNKAENKPRAEEAPRRAGEPPEKKPDETAAKPNEPTAPPEDEVPPGPPPQDLPPAPTEGGGTCTVIATAGREFKQTSGGGPAAANIFQWQTPETRKAKGYKDEGFILNCNGSDIKLAITSTGAIPFGAKDYKVGQDDSIVRVKGTMGNTTIARAAGMVAIEKFDDKRLAGRLTLYINETVPPADMFKLIADFDFTCNGLSACK